MDTTALNSSTSKSSKELRDEKNRDYKLEEQVLKSLPSSASIEEKFNILLKKYIENEKNSRKLNLTLKSHEKNYETLLREKDVLQKEYNKGILMKDKLEQVCREQQKLIKSVKNESFNKIKEEEEKRKESQAKFQDSINEISLTLNKNNEENIKLKEDNLEMAKKLKFLAEQYQARETQLQKISEQIQLETQLHEAKLAKIQMESAIEKEVLLREKQLALDELLNCRKLVEEMRSREEFLKEQLNVYTSKYDDFQNSLQKSNDIFVTYKEEIEKMYKNSRKLEKECLEWKKKWEKSNVSLIELSTEKQEKDGYIMKLTKQMQQLQKLLRALQVERNSLHQILKDHNIPRPPVPILPPEPDIVQIPAQSKQSVKMEQMAKNCAELKQTLSKLQDQMKTITDKQISDTVVQSTSSSKEKENKKQKTNKKSKNKGDKISISTKDKINSVENSVNISQTLGNPESLNLSSTNNQLKDSENNETLNSVPNIIPNDIEKSNFEQNILEDSKITEISENKIVQNVNCEGLQLNIVDKTTYQENCKLNNSNVDMNISSDMIQQEISDGKINQFHDEQIIKEKSEIVSTLENLNLSVTVQPEISDGEINQFHDEQITKEKSEIVVSTFENSNLSVTAQQEISDGEMNQFHDEQITKEKSEIVSTLENLNLNVTVQQQCDEITDNATIIHNDHIK